MSMRRILGGIAAVCAGALLACSGVLPASAGGFQRRPSSLLKKAIEEAKKGDFFTFFHLNKVGETTEIQKRTVISFKPDKDSPFYSLVTVKVTLDNRSITQIDLILARSFIEDRKNTLFARDIAKSLLQDGLPAEDKAKVIDLIHEIASPSGSDAPTVLMRKGAQPKLPDSPSPGYLTFLGRKPMYDQKLPKSVLHLENRKVEGVDSLVITLQVKA